MTPKGMPAMVIAMIPIRIAPRTLYAVKMEIKSSPAIASSTFGSVKSPMAMPSVKVPIPVFLKPRYATKNPMDAEMATLIFLGIIFTIMSLIPKMVRARKIIPEIRIMLIMEPKERLPSCKRAPNRKFVPIPVERAKGKFA